MGLNFLINLKYQKEVKLNHAVRSCIARTKNNAK